MTDPVRPIALVSARAAHGLDEDLEPLRAALKQARLVAEVVDWDDPGVDWSRYALGVLRSTWDYTTRLPEFLDWLERAGAQTQLHNPPAVVRWSVDKHYLGDLERTGIPVVPSQFVEPSQAAASALQGALRQWASAELVVKPAIGAGSRDAQRHGREETAAIAAHMERLLAERRSVLLQPYLERVDAQGETALVYFDGRYSHAFRKGPLLQRGHEPVRALFAAEQITSRTPEADERALGDRVLATLPFAVPLYARVDLIRSADGSPCVLELELAEPSLYFPHAAGSAARFAAAIARRLAA